MFEVLPWHSALWSAFTQQSKRAHAYLFYGEAGIGKRQFAEALRAWLLCQAPTDKACGQCASCQLLAAGTHPDSFVLEPEEADKAIKIDQVRDLVDFVAQTPHLAGRKLVLIEPVEAMNVNAANALLKSLEEPSASTVLLLVSHQPSRLLPTIKSRCVQQACPKPSTAQSLDWLATQLPQEPIDELLVLAAGAPLRAVKLHEQGAVAARAQLVEGVKALLKQQNAPSQLAERLNELNLTLLFDWFSTWAHQILCYQLSLDEAQLGLADMRKVLKYLAEKSSPAQVLAVQQWILEQRQKVLGRANLNRQLLLEALLSRWASLVRSG